MSLRNVTIDNAANATLIVYQPPLCTGTGWTVNTTQGFGGSYTSCTTSAGPSAGLTFTGVAIFYVSPNFDGTSMRFKLDGVLSNDVNISSPAGQSANKVSKTRIMWEQVELENKLHTLEVTPGNGSTTLNIGSFIITEVDPTSKNATVSPQIPNSSSSPIGLGLPSQSEKTTRLSIGLGTAFGSLSFLIFIWISWNLSRRNREHKKRYSWSKPAQHLVINDDPETTFDRNAFTQDSHHSPTSPQTGSEVVVPMHPIPPNSISRDSLSVQDFWTEEWHSDLLYNRPPSSQGHINETVGSISRQPTFTTKLEPMRTSSASTSPPTHSTEAPRMDKGAFVARTPTYAAKLEPVRASTLPLTSHLSATIDDGTYLSRSTTFSSKLEPVRKATLPRP